MSIILRDDFNLQVPEFTEMLINDEQRPRDFSLKTALSRLKGSALRIVADIDSTHSGSKVNGRVYPAKELKKALPSWTAPYPRPFLEKHPSKGGLFTSADEPTVLGRVLDGRFNALVDRDGLKRDWINPPNRGKGSGFVQNAVLIPGQDAVEKVMDMRILTVSVGMIANSMQCPICLKDWVPSMKKKGEPGCDHRPGNEYEVEDKHFEGKLPFYFVSRGLVFDHIASTFRPAQPYASILGFKFAEESIQDSFQGEHVDSNFGGLALYDEDGHVVRFMSDHQETVNTPPLTHEDALVLASMEQAGVLNLAGEFSDGQDVVAIKAAIDKVVASGDYQQWQAQTKDRERMGLKGSMPVINDAFLASSWKFVDRYSGEDKDVLRLKLHAAVTSDLPKTTKEGGSGMNLTTAQIEELSAQIFDQLKDLNEEPECMATVLKDKLDADLFAKVDFSTLTDEDLAEIEKEEREAEIEAVADGLLDAVLTAAARKKLPDSAFCGPNRSFPAHDKAHIRNGLSRLPQATRFSGEQKARIKACLDRKAKAAGIESEDNAQDDQNQAQTDDLKILTDQVKALSKQLDDAQGRINLLTRELKTASADRDLYAAKVHDALALQILDLRSGLQKPDVMDLSDEDKAAYLKRLMDRSTDSLEDSLADLRLEVEKSTTEETTDQNEPAPDPNAIHDGEDGEGTDGDAGDGSGTDNNDTDTDTSEAVLDNKALIQKHLGG